MPNCAGKFIAMEYKSISDAKFPPLQVKVASANRDLTIETQHACPTSGWDLSCTDSSTYRSALGLSCSFHIEYLPGSLHSQSSEGNCWSWLGAGASWSDHVYSEKDITDIIAHCPCTCGVSCDAVIFAPTAAPTLQPTQSIQNRLEGIPRYHQYILLVDENENTSTTQNRGGEGSKNISLHGGGRALEDSSDGGSESKVIEEAVGIISSSPPRVSVVRPRGAALPPMASSQKNSSSSNLTNLISSTISNVPIWLIGAIAAAGIVALVSAIALLSVLARRRTARSSPNSADDSIRHCSWHTHEESSDKNAKRICKPYVSKVINLDAASVGVVSAAHSEVTTKIRNLSSSKRWNQNSNSLESMPEGGIGVEETEWKDSEIAIPAVPELPGSDGPDERPFFMNIEWTDLARVIIGGNAMDQSATRTSTNDKSELTPAATSTQHTPSTES